jgi:hypothetical protein
MNDCKRCADVIDFFWERQRLYKEPRSNAIAELALDKCEEMYRISRASFLKSRTRGRRQPEFGEASLRQRSYAAEQAGVSWEPF